MARSLNPFLVPFCLLILMAVTGCGGGSKGASAPPPLSGPSNLTVSRSNGSWLYMYFTWNAGIDPIDGYELEANLGTGTFVKWGSLIPPSFTNTNAAYDNLKVAESSDLQFRLRAVKDTTYSAYSNLATYHFGLNQPVVNSVASTGAGVTVQWSNKSAIATTLQLERGITTDFGATYLWTPLPGVAFGSTSYLDTQAPENSNVAYRVTYAKGLEQAATISSYTHTGLKSPTGLTAAPLAEGVRLTWQNNSGGAAEVVVMRSPGFDSYASYQEIVHLGPTVTTYTDLQLPTGYYTYRVEARQAPSSVAQSTAVQVATLPVTASPLLLKPTVLTLPDGVMGARDAAGGWYLAQEVNYSSWNIRPPAGSSIPGFILPSATALAAPSLALDGQGHPHTVYLRSVVQGSSEQAIVHAWFDGTAWQTEEVARRTLGTLVSGQGVSFALDGAGSPHLVWPRNSLSSLGLEYAYKAADGSWQAENLDVLVPAPNPLYAMRLALDGNGTPAVFLFSFTALHLLERQGANQWRGEAVPAGTVAAGYYGFSELLFTRAGVLHLFFVRQHLPSDGTFALDLCEIKKSNGAWGSVQIVASVPDSGAFDAGAAAKSAVSERLALTFSPAAGHRVMTCDQGVWSTCVIGPNTTSPSFLGFDAADKLYLLQPVTRSYNNTPVTYVLYAEAP